MNQNFDLNREVDEQSRKDWQFGEASEASLVSIPLNERVSYLPQGELQYDSKVDFTDCASRSPVNHLEAIFTYHYQHAMKPENKKWLVDKGYIVFKNGLGYVQFSDRFIAKLSNTTKLGNSLKSPVETIRTKGLVPKSLLPKEDWMGWDDYYAPIAQDLIDLGAEFLLRFTIRYEQVDLSLFETAIKNDMLGVAGYGWPQPTADDVYPRVEGSTFNHAFLIYGTPDYQIFDNYYDNGAVGDFTKTLAPNYNFFPYGYRVYVAAESVVNENAHVFVKNLAYGMNDLEVANLQKALVSLGYSIPDAITTQFLGETKTALALFQKSKGIVDDGSNFGPRTRQAMNSALNPSTPFGGSLITLIQSLFSGV